MLNELVKKPHVQEVISHVFLHVVSMIRMVCVISCDFLSLYL